MMGSIIRKAGFTVFATIFMFACFQSPDGTSKAMAGDDSYAVTVYSSGNMGANNRGYGRQGPSGYALVKHERDIDLSEGVGVIKFTDVAAKIDPTTVSFTSLTYPQTTSVLEQNYQFDLVSQEKLVERFIDHEISVEQIVGDKIETMTGTLLSSSGRGLILSQEDGEVRVVNNYSRISFPKLPGGLITRPTLVWDVAAENGGEHRTRLTYQTEGFDWRADYNVLYRDGKDENSGLLDIGAWVTINNQSGASYKEAKLKLMAGEVHRVPRYQEAGRSAYAVADEAPVAKMKRGFEEKSFFEYHLYTLGRPTTITDNSTKQVELFPVARSIAAEKQLILQARGISGDKEKVDVYIRFKNSEDNQLGIPLPAGLIRVNKLDEADNTQEFIGEDVVDHTPKNEHVLIKLGSAFDVVGERKRTNYKRIDTMNRQEETYEIKVRNHKDQLVKVIVREALYGWQNFRIVDNNLPFEKIDSNTVEFPLNIESDGEAIVKYTVKYSW